MWLIAVVALSGCSYEPDGPKDKKKPDTDKTDTDSDSDSDTDIVHTGDTGPDERAICSLATQPEPPGTFNTLVFRTEEDFDFDGGGFLLTQSNSNIAALDRQGNVDYISIPGFHDPSGLRVMSTGDIALAEPDTGGLRIVFRQTGGTNIAMSGLTNPNGVAVDSNGYVYISEFTNNGRVAIIDPYTQENWLISNNLPYPNGLALSYEDRLFIMTDDSIMVTERLGPTEFGPLSVFMQFPNNKNFWSITLDVCDNLYTVDYSQGEVFKIDGVLATTELIVDIPEWGSYSALRFGNGVGGWERDVLYVTNRGDLFGVPIGIPGKPPVAPEY